MRKEKDIHWIPPEKLTLSYCLTMILFLLACVGLEYYFHYLRDTTIIYTHLFYIPVVAAAWWWGVKGGFSVSIFLATMHIAFELPDININILARSVLFVFVGTIVGLIRSQRKWAKNIQKSEDRFRQVVANAQEWVWEVDTDGLYTYTSPILE
ncbi:MAG: hypothetical protein KAT56_00185, partial [Sedimentisphaerales bacterium]|nr:hypothetical protein [Sedimentisphaerales bacterium]